MTSTLEYSPNKFYDISATIADAQTKSAVIDLGGLELVGIFVPSGFDGSTLSLEASATSGGTYVPVQNGVGQTYSLTAAANVYVPFPNLAIIAGLRYIKLVSGTAQSGGATNFTLVVRSV